MLEPIEPKGDLEMLYRFIERVTLQCHQYEYDVTLRLNVTPG